MTFQVGIAVADVIVNVLNVNIIIVMHRVVSHLNLDLFDLRAANRLNFRRSICLYFMDANRGCVLLRTNLNSRRTRNRLLRSNLLKGLNCFFKIFSKKFKVAKLEMENLLSKFSQRKG